MSSWMSQTEQMADYYDQKAREEERTYNVDYVVLDTDKYWFSDEDHRRTGLEAMRKIGHYDDRPVRVTYSWIETQFPNHMFIHIEMRPR